MKAEHARQRAKERFGLDLSTPDVKTITGLIRGMSPLATRIGRNGKQERWVVRWAGRRLTVVWDVLHERICTVF